MVPEDGLEPSRGQASRDFKSRYTCYSHSSSLNLSASCQFVLSLVGSYYIKKRDQNFQAIYDILLELFYRRPTLVLQMVG